MNISKKYSDEGLVVLEHLLTAEEVETANQELDTILENKNELPGVIYEEDGKTPRSLANPHLYNTFFQKLICLPRILNPVKSFLKDEVYVFQLGVNFKEAFRGDMWFWHQDFPTYHYDDHIPTSNMVNVIIYLDDVVHSNSPLMIVPKSHKMNGHKTLMSKQKTSYSFRYIDEGNLQEAISDNGIEFITKPKGTTIFMDVNMIHGSNVNMSPWKRRLITLTYNAISNKATKRSKRPSEIIYDDSDLTPIQALDDNCLLM